MAIRTIDAPGIEIHEIDKSQYSPAMTGTKVLVTGFANSGEDYIPMIFTSKSAWLNYYGEPDNEAERYFYTASMEVLNQNGVVNCCKLPYENEARDKFVGFKYKLNTSRVGNIKTVFEGLQLKELSSIASALPNSELFSKEAVGYFIDNCNITDPVDKGTLQAAESLTVLEQPVWDGYDSESGEYVPRADGSSVTSSDTFLSYYGEDGLDSLSALSVSFLKQITKKQLLSYADDLSGQTGLIPKLKAYYFITDIPRDEYNQNEGDDWVEQAISVYVACSEKADYAVLTACNKVNRGSSEISDFMVEDIKDLVVCDPKTSSTDADDLFAVFESNREDLLTQDFYPNNDLYVRYVNGVDAFQIMSDVELSADELETIKFNFSTHNFTLVKGDDPAKAVEYFTELKENSEALAEAQLDTVKSLLMWNEIKQADETVDMYWSIEAKGSPSLYDMEQIDEYRTEESRVPTNQILIVDKTRKPYGKVPEDKFHKDDKRELIGVIPIVTTAANALYAQSMIDVADEDVTDYETIHDVHTLDAEYKYLGHDYHSHNVMAEGQLSTVAVISQRFNNVHVEGLDTADDFFDSLALEANNYFSSIALQGDGSFDRENMKKIGVVVVKAFLDASEGNRISFQTVESFVGSLDRDAKNPNTGATTFIDTLVNEQSEYINVFSNCMPTDALKKTYNEVVDIFVMPHETADVATLGFYEGMCEEDIDISESILKALDCAYEKVTDINERDIDIVVDAGVSNIAQFIKSVYGTKGFYDPASPDAAMWKCKKDNDVKMWKTVIMKMDNFCKNVRKDCMFVADGPRPYCLQGQKKIVRPSKPKNTIDAEILPYTKYLTGINTSYGAGYCDWFQVADEFTGDYFWCPPSIKAMGAYIYTDLNFQYWDAPAGLTRGVVAALDVAFSPTNKQAGQIYTKNWNYAVNYPQDGIVLEGQKTLQTKPTALDRVNVRRLLLRLERATYKVLRYVVYEGNTAYMRQRVVDLLDPYFKEAKVGGGLYDYKIICDESNNTPETIDRNELHISVGVKPTKTIEFIICNFVILSTGASWSEM